MLTHTPRHSRTGDQPISMDALLQLAPSVAAAEAHEGMSQRYTYIPTLDVIKRLVDEGFVPFNAQQKRCRDEGRADFTKHLIRLRHQDYLGNQEANEVVLINSHDGSSSYEIMGGVFRMVCANGLIVGRVMESIRIRHSGDVMQNVIDASFKVVDDFKVIDSRREVMKALPMPEARQEAFARAALDVRWPDPEHPAPITTTQVLEARRSYDQANDLWTVFNRVQENLIRGGQYYARRDENGRMTAQAHTRAVNGINQSVSINRRLWDIADDFARRAELIAA